MLKVENNRSLNIRWIKRESFFSLSFWSALVVAAVLHGSLFVIFRLKSTFPNDVFSSTPTPIISARAVPLSSDQRVVALSSKEWPQALRSISIPPLSSPEIRFTRRELDQGGDEEMWIQKKRDFPFFSQVERLHYEPFLAPTSRPIPATQVMVFIENVENENKIEIIEDGTSFIRSDDLFAWEIERKEILFDALLDVHSGYLFWFEPVENGLTAHEKDVGMQVLRRMRFRPSFEGIISSLRVEVHFL